MDRCGGGRRANLGRFKPDLVLTDRQRARSDNEIVRHASPPTSCKKGLSLLYVHSPKVRRFGPRMPWRLYLQKERSCLKGNSLRRQLSLSFSFFICQEIKCERYERKSHVHSVCISILGFLHCRFAPCSVAWATVVVRMNFAIIYALVDWSSCASLRIARTTWPRKQQPRLPQWMNLSMPQRRLRQEAPMIS